MKNLLVAILLIAGTSALACDTGEGPGSPGAQCKAPKKEKEAKLTFCNNDLVDNCLPGKAEKEEAPKLACGSDGIWGHC